MRRLGRRAIALAGGISIAVLEAAVGPPALKAGGVTLTQEECRALGGRPEWDDEVDGYWCETPAKDAACERQHPDAAMAYYDVTLGRCETCFLTTACAGRLQLEDDCFELAALRRFRDEVLVNMPGGGHDIAAYYMHAPRIVAAIAARADAGRELDRLYALYVLPSACAARLGLSGIARRIYTAMMRDLSRRYGVEI